MQEYTFSIIKPDATKRNLIGQINAMLEKEGLQIVAQKMTKLNKSQAEAFYAEHKSRPFFSSLITYITSGPIVLQVLKGANAIVCNRNIMGDTDPNNAKNGTIRKLFGENIEANSVHGSDSQESADREIRFFFSDCEIYD